MEPPDTDSPSPTDEEIALGAYRIWLQEGSPHGKDQDHWLKAKAQLIQEKAREAAEEAVSTKPE